jgi:hypothetical protein
MTYLILQNKTDLLTPPINATQLNGERLHQHATGEYIRAMLDGGPPSGTPPDAFGPYRDIIAILLQAYTAGHTQGA